MFSKCFPRPNEASCALQQCWGGHPCGSQRRNRSCSAMRRLTMGVSEGLLQGREEARLQLRRAPANRAQRGHHPPQQLLPLRAHQLRRQRAQHGCQAPQQRLPAPLPPRLLQPLQGRPLLSRQSQTRSCRFRGSHNLWHSPVSLYALSPV